MSRRPIRVLVVDDDPAFRGLCVEGIGRGGRADPLAASTPREALAVLEERTIDVVVSDVSLPGADGDGVDLYRAVRDRWPALPFVFFTGTPAVALSTRVDLREDSAVRYVRRGCLPGRYHALRRRIERSVDRDRPVESVRDSPLRAIEAFCR